MVHAFDFFVTLVDGKARVAFARPFFECLAVQLIDGFCEGSAAAPLFVRETNVEQRLFPDRASETGAVVALGCLAGGRALGFAGPDPHRRVARAPFALDALDLRLEDAAGRDVAPSTTVLLLRVLSRSS